MPCEMKKFDFNLTSFSNKMENTEENDSTNAEPEIIELVEEMVNFVSKKHEDEANSSKVNEEMVRSNHLYECFAEIHRELNIFTGILHFLFKYFKINFLFQ